MKRSMNAVRELLNESRVLDLGPLPAPRLSPQATVEQALQFLVRGRRGAIVVVDGAKPVGIFTERDVLYRTTESLLALDTERRRTPVSRVMSKPPVTIRRQASLHQAISEMTNRGFRHLVVVDGRGDLKGLLNTNDLIQFLTDQFPEDTVNLPPRLDQRYARPEGA